MSLGVDYFDDLYSRRDDPWRLRDRWYEARKRAITVAALPQERFSSALEIGCSVGMLTEALAARCDTLLAVDVAARAVQVTRERLRGSAHVSVEQLDVSTGWPAGERDLVVFSEVGYYFDSATLGQLARQASSALSEDGIIVTCHWRYPVSDYPLAGDDARRIIREQSGLVQSAHYIDRDFGLEVLARRGLPSVAAREGLVSDTQQKESRSGKPPLRHDTIDAGSRVLRARPALDPGSRLGLEDL